MSDPKGNLIFVVCKPCEEKNEPDFGAKLAVRSQRGWYEQMIPTRQLNAWFEQHRNCGGRGHPDHFVMALGFEKDHDQKALEQAVKLAVVG